MRNPTWHRDELILALDLYLRHNPVRINQNHSEVRALSKILNALPIHTERPHVTRFRNPNRVYMKLCNFLRLDLPTRGRASELAELWRNRFGRSLRMTELRLAKTAEAIRTRIGHHTPLESITTPEDEEDEFQEGKVLFRATDHGNGTERWSSGRRALRCGSTGHWPAGSADLISRNIMASSALLAFEN